MLIQYDAIVQRIGQWANQGIYAAPVNEDVFIRYNEDNEEHTLIDLYYDWAYRHNGKVLLPLGNNCALNTLQTCDTYIGITADKQWIQGTIMAVGSPWDKTIRSMGEYSIPDDLMLDSARFWLALDNVTSGTDFNFDGWMANSISDGVIERSLKDSWENSIYSSIYAYKEVEV